MAKVVSLDCPRCGTQSRVQVGAIDVDTGEVVNPTYPRWEFEFEFEFEY